MPEKMLVSIRCRNHSPGEAHGGRMSVACHQCFDIPAGDPEGPSVSGTRMKDLEGAYLSQGGGTGQGMLCCRAARKAIHGLWRQAAQYLFDDKCLRSSLELSLVIIWVLFCLLPVLLKIKPSSGKGCNTPLERHYFQLKISYVPS